jgi:signal transduction histidine kinase
MTAVVARTASVIRSLVLAYIVAQVLIWWPFYAVSPDRLAGPAVAGLCCVAMVARLRRRRPGWPLIVTDSAVQVALALGAAWCVPPAMRGDTSNWLYLALASQVLIPAWFAPTGLFVPLAVASSASYWAAADLAGRAGAAGRSPAAGAASLLGIGVVAWAGLRLMAPRAARADAALDQADRDARAELVALTRAAERREHDRLLHDTVLNTLTALARGGDSPAGEVRGRCRHDVTLMEYALRDTAEAEEEALGPFGGLVIGLEAVAAELRARGLTVHLDLPGLVPAPAGGGASPLTEPWPEVPAPVAAALAHAVREALANVASHAGTGQAWVALRPGPAGGLEVTVRDEGAGFDPARTDPARLGVRRSIVERVADWGGTARVESAPGQGTLVRISWVATPVSDLVPW